MSNYTLTQSEFTRLKKRLTYRNNRLKKAKESGDKDRIIAEARQVELEVENTAKVFEEKGYPDSHHDWVRAAEDAQIIRRRAEKGLPV